MLTQDDINPIVKLALDEDIGSGDITAGLVDSREYATATVITREAGVLCGTQFVDAVFSSVDPDVKVDWKRWTVTDSNPTMCYSPWQEMHEIS